MRRLMLSAACVMTSATLMAGAGAARQPGRADGGAVVVLDNTRVRIFKTTAGSLAGFAHGGAVLGVTLAGALVAVVVARRQG